MKCVFSRLQCRLFIVVLLNLEVYCLGYFFFFFLDAYFILTTWPCRWIQLLFDLTSDQCCTPPLCRCCDIIALKWVCSKVWTVLKGMIKSVQGNLENEYSDHFKRFFIFTHHSCLHWVFVVLSTFHLCFIWRDPWVLSLEPWVLSLESWALISWDSTFLLNLFTWPQTSCCQAAIWRLITGSDSSWLWFESFSPSTFQQELAHQNERVNEWVISDVDVIIFRYKMLFCFWLMMLTKGHSVHLLLVVLLERVSK